MCPGTFPLDLTKTRLQIQGQQAKHLMSCGISPVRPTYRGTLDALLKISKEEGIVALYRGYVRHGGLLSVYLDLFQFDLMD